MKRTTKRKLNTAILYAVLVLAIVLLGLLVGGSESERKPLRDRPDDRQLREVVHVVHDVVGAEGDHRCGRG